MGRRVSRETAMKLLYQLEMHNDDMQEQIKAAFEDHAFSEADKKYINDVVQGVFDNKEYIDRLVEKYSKGWKINRISKVDISILRLSIYEIGFRDDIPFNVSINEAVELAKKYSNEEAGAFINGILGKVPKMRALPAENEAGN